MRGSLVFGGLVYLCVLTVTSGNNNARKRTIKYNDADGEKVAYYTGRTIEVDVLDQNGNPTGEKKFIPDTKRSPGSKWYRIFKGHWTDGLMNGHMEMNLMGYCTFAGQFENGQVVSGIMKDKDGNVLKNSDWSGNVTALYFECGKQFAPETTTTTTTTTTALPMLDLKVLVVGNNYITNSMLDYARNIAGQHRATLTFTRRTPNNYDFLKHEEQMGQINAAGYDVVVLQEMSLQMAFTPSMVYHGTFDPAQCLVKRVRQQNSNVKIVFFENMGYKNGYQNYCKRIQGQIVSYPPLCSYEGMQNRTTESATSMAYLFQPATVAPMGSAAAHLRDTNMGAFNSLFSSNGMTANNAGNYLAGAALAGAITGRSVEAGFDGSVSSNTASAARDAVNMYLTNSLYKFPNSDNSKPCPSCYNASA